MAVARSSSRGWTRSSPRAGSPRVSAYPRSWQPPQRMPTSFSCRSGLRPGATERSTSRSSNASRRRSEKSSRRHTFVAVIYRSTVPPGTVDGRLRPVLERASGRHADRDFGVAMAPEFLREGSGVEDFFDPPFTIAGVRDDRSLEVVDPCSQGSCDPSMGFRSRPPSRSSTPATRSTR